MWTVLSWPIALAACGFPRPADVNPDGDYVPIFAPSNDLGPALDQS